LLQSGYDIRTVQELLASSSCTATKTREEARASLFDYLEVFYNRQRRHSTIKYEAPLLFEASTTA